jgi:hypothetical protein
VVEGIDADSVAGSFFVALGLIFMYCWHVILFVGIGFDATCSLVALDNEDKPITVSPTGTRLMSVKS